MNKNIFLIFLLTLVVIVSISLVSATTTIKMPVTGGNYSTTLNLTVETDLTHILNVSCHYSSSGGAAHIFLAEITNNTPTQLIFQNDTIDVSEFTQTSTYNISCFVSWWTNGSIINESASVTGITIDYTAPAVLAINAPASNANLKNSVVLNATVGNETIGIDFVCFNFTNTTGQQAFLKATNISATHWNVSLDTNLYADGKYTLTVYANDTKRDNESTILNNSISISVRIDNTAPSITLTESSSAEYSLAIDVLIVETGSNLTGTCSVDRGTLSGTGHGRELTETGLNCGTSYSYTVTCADNAGNSGSSVSTSFSTDACVGGGSLSSSSLTWTSTQILSDEQFEQGYTKELAVNNRVKVKVGSTYHHVGVTKLTETTATINISSDTIQVILGIGEDAKLDVTDDGFYDIYVILNAIANNKADVTVKKIHEEIPEGEGEVATTGEILEGEEDEGAEGEKDLTWLWILIGVIILAAVIGGGRAIKKKQ